MSTEFTREDIREAARFYSEDQERDDNGRWTAAGSSEGVKAEHAGLRHEHEAAGKFHRDAADYHAKSGDKTAASAHTIAAIAHEEAAKSGDSSDKAYAREASSDALIAAHNALNDRDRAAAPAATGPNPPWSVHAGGTSAAEGKHGYTKATPHGEYHISPVSNRYGRHLGYQAHFVDTKGKLGGGLWHDLGRHSSPNAAKGVAAAHYTKNFGGKFGAQDEWEIEQFRDVSDEERDKLAKEGHALPGGGFPIANETDLKNAIQAIGRAKNPGKAKAHIRAEAKRLGREDLIPETWAAEEEQEFYSEDQPRDEGGRFAGGGEGKAAETAESREDHQRAADYHREAAAHFEKVASAHGAGRTKSAWIGAAAAHTEAARQHAKATMGGKTGAHYHRLANEASRDAHAETRSVRRLFPNVQTSADTAGAQAFAAERSAVRLSFAAAVEVADEPEHRVVDGVEYVVGKPIHIFPRGQWAAVDGRQVEFNDDDAEAMLADLRTRHSDVALTFDHETDKARGSESGGWMPVSKFVFRQDGLWNDEPLWVVEVYEDLLKTGKFRYLSGDALGIGSARSGDAFHPRRLLAASLVPKPGFVRGLKGITLAADETAAIEAWLTEPKESDMKMTRAELCQHMGLSADASKEDLKAALAKWAEEEANEPEHKDSLKAGADEPDADDEDHTADECDDPKCEKHSKFKEGKMGANEQTPTSGADDQKLAAEKFAALGKDIADKAVDAAKATANEAALKQVEARFAAEKQAKEVDDLLLAAEKDGRLTAANREVFRETFAASYDLGKKLLGALPKPAAAPEDPLTPKNAFITGNGSRPLSRDDLKSIFDNPDRDSAKYAAQGKFLTAVARFSAQTGVDPASAMASVLRGENEKLEREIFTAGDRTAESFTGETVGQFRASQRQLPVDPELIEFLKKRQNRGDIPRTVIREEIQQFASITDFQPSARTTLPMALGYFQAEFVGDEALPVFVGGADEKAAWPELAFEKFAAVAQATGLLGAPTETSLNVTWHTVTLDKYPVRGNIDRRARAASITLPRGIDTIMLENLKSQVGVTKETAQAAFLTTNGNYYDSSYYPSVTAWSSAGTPAAYVGKPIDDIYAGMQHVRVGVRAWPDLLLLSPAAAAAMRKNQQVIDTVRFTGTMDRPGTGVSNQTIAALFAGLFNLTIVVGEAGTASLPSGSPVSDVWGLDAWLLCTGKGAIEAPRFGMTVAAAGSPRVRAFPAEHLGADGADAIVYTDAWSIVSIAKKAGYRMVGASASI